MFVFHNNKSTKKNYYNGKHTVFKIKIIDWPKIPFTVNFITREK